MWALSVHVKGNDPSAVDNRMSKNSTELRKYRTSRNTIQYFVHSWFLFFLSLQVPSPFVPDRRRTKPELGKSDCSKRGTEIFDVMNRPNFLADIVIGQLFWRSLLCAVLKKYYLRREPPSWLWFQHQEAVRQPTFHKT